MPQPPDVALAHYSDRQSLVTAGAEVAGQMWAEVNPDRIVESWTAQVPELTAVLSGAQFGAARQADPYLDEVAAWQNLDPATASPIDPRAFAGTASDGRGLMSLLMSPAFSALQVIASGLGSMQGMSLGRQHLDTIARTQVADAGRLADGVALAARRGLDGYTRVVVGKTCSRCLLLAGKKYRWSDGFKRHPHCDCVHLPCRLAEHLQVVQDPGAIYRSMTAKERQRAGWSLADQQAIADGADLAQITNAHRGVYTAGGRKFTTEGTTKRAFARSRLGKQARMTPEQIYAEALDRDEALRLLYDHGYLVNEPAVVRRAEGARAIARPGPAAAELAADPALKMTVAELKAIAKDNGVPLYGATKKRDIISEIRQWERDKARSGGKVLLPDGPIGKPISFKPEPIEAPPLGVPSPSRKVLSGSSLNDWADHFKYDQQYARHEFVDAAGNTAAEGVRVQDLRAVLGSHAEGIGDYVVQTGTAWRFDGVAYLIEHGEADSGAPWVSRALHELRAAHEAIPAAARANQSYAVLSGRNPGDSYWARRFNNPNHTAGASASQGHINIWRFQPTTSRIDVDVLRHETGHNLDDLVGHHAHGSESPAWASAADADAISAARIRELKSDPYVGIKAEVDPARDFARGVTTYGKSSAAEDYAESVMLYQRGEIAFGQPAGEAAARRLYFRDVYPERAKILDAQFPDLAKAQQQAIAELKTKATAPVVAPVADVSKLNVTQLRALAKERGIKVPTKALKADIVKLLQGGTAPAAPLAGAAKRAAARVRQAEIDRRGAVGDLLANMDELIAKKADRAVFVERLDYAATTGVAAATVAALRLVIDDKTKLRAAMTRIGTKNGLKPVGRAGQKVKFDDALHDALGAPPAPGAQVLVVRRGTTLTLNGETIPLDKAQVTTAVTPAKRVVAPKAPAEPVEIRGLFTADDTTIEAALRDVYEGKFGPYTTKVDVHITRAGTRVDGRGRVREIEPSISVSGRIYDAAGREIGDFGRTVGSTTVHYGDGTVRREVWAEHSIVQMDAKYQGKGFGGEFNRRAIDWYRQSGVHGISLNDHNGYVWASQGFNFSGGVVPGHVSDALRELVADLRAGRLKDKYAKVIPKGLREAPSLHAQISQAEELLARLDSTTPGSPGYPTAYEMSQLGRSSGQRGKTQIWLGKHLNVPTGEMILNPEEGVVTSK